MVHVDDDDDDDDVVSKLHRCVCQAINNLAVTDENKLKIVEAGALPLYVKLLSPECDESLQREAARGLWSLAFMCKTQIVNEPGCIDGLCYFFFFLCLLVEPRFFLCYY